MSWATDITEKMAIPKDIDVKEFGVNGLETVQFRFPSTKMIGALYSNPEYLKVKNEESKQLLFAQLVTWKALSLCDQEIKLNEVQDWPMDVFTKISGKIMESFDVNGDYLKNLQK